MSDYLKMTFPAMCITCGWRRDDGPGENWDTIPIDGKRFHRCSQCVAADRRPAIALEDK